MLVASGRGVGPGLLAGGPGVGPGLVAGGRGVGVGWVGPGAAGVALAIPGLLQTEAYARALFRACKPADTDEEISQQFDLA